MIKIISVFALGASLALSTVVKAEDKETEIPLIPVGAVIENKEKPRAKKKELKPVQINMKPGVNEIVAIAKGHLNRVVTPFSNPIVSTVSDADISTKENVVYVSTYNSSPVTIFVTQKDSESVALSLTLVPKKVPPQEIFLSSGVGNVAGLVGGGNSGSFFGTGVVNKAAERWEKKSRYLETIKAVMVSLAKGEMPTGYQMSPLANVLSVLPEPVCRQDGLNFDWSNGQALFGQNLNVTVGLVHNNSNQDVEIEANPCLGIAAFASWPEVYLQPGQKTEVYVIRKQNEYVQKATPRPSLLN